MCDIEIGRGDNIILAEVELMPGDANLDGQIELNDIVHINDNFGDVTLEGVSQAQKVLDFNEDGVVNQLDRDFIKQAYAQISKCSPAIIEAIDNKIIKITIQENSEEKYIQEYSSIYYTLNTNKEVECINSDRIYLVETGIVEDEVNPNSSDEMSENEDMYILKPGERFINGGAYINGSGTDWQLCMYFNEEFKNVKVVLGEGVFKTEECVSEETEINLGISLDASGPIIELNGSAQITTQNETTQIDIPLMLTEQHSGLNNFTADNIDVLVDEIIVNVPTKVLTLNSSENGINQYTLHLEGIDAKGQITLYIPDNVVFDKAGNSANETTLEPVIGQTEETMQPIILEKDYVASVEKQGQPETATNYATLAEAVLECDEGEVIKLLTSFCESITIESGKTVILDLNGKTLGKVSETVIKNNGTLTIIDSVGNGAVIQKNMYNLSNYTLDNNGTATIRANLSSNDSTIYNTGILNIEAGTISAGGRAIDSTSGEFMNAIINISGGIIQSGYIGIYIFDTVLNMTAGEIIVTSSSPESYGIMASYGEISMLGGKLILNRDGNDYRSDGYAIKADRTPITLGIDDGIIDKAQPYIWSFSRTVSKKQSDFNFYDGVIYGFDCNEPTAVPQGYKYKSYYISDGPDKHCLIKDNAVAYIQNGDNITYYDSLQNAINACPDNPEERTIINQIESEIIQCNCQLDGNGETHHTCGLVIPNGKKIKIDTNCQDITVSNGIINNGDLIIQGYEQYSYSQLIRIDTTAKAIINNGTIEMIKVHTNSTILNNGTMLLKDSGTDIYSSTGIVEAIVNNGYLSITGNGKINIQEGDGIINNEGATLILGDENEDLNSQGLSVCVQTGYAIINEGTFEFYAGTIIGENGIQGEINKIRDQCEYIITQQNGYITGNLGLKGAVACIEGQSGPIYCFTLEEAIELLTKDGYSNLILLKDVEEGSIKVKYNPLKFSKGESIYLNGHYIKSTGTTILNNISGSLYLNGPGKIISTDGCAIQNDGYLSINEIEIEGKTYGIINNSYMDLELTKISANVAIKNTESLNINVNNQYEDSGLIIGTEIGIENYAYLNISNSINITANVGILNGENASCYLYIGDSNITGTEVGILNGNDASCCVYGENNNITGTSIGVTNNGTFEMLGGKIVGTIAVQGNEITTDSYHRIVNTQLDDVQIVEIQETTAPTMYFYKYNTKESSPELNDGEIEFILCAYESGSGLVTDYLTADNITLRIGNTEYVPTKKELKYCYKYGDYYYYSLVVSGLQIDNNGKYVTFTVAKDALKDAYNNLSDEIVFNMYTGVSII